MKNTVLQIQTLYPRIYMACHVEHVKRRTSAQSISARDASILAHLSTPYFQSPKNLAAHMNIAASTISEALHHLVSLGYASFKTDQIDARQTIFSITPKGNDAIVENSVLDADKITQLLGTMSNDEQSKVVDGLKLLANAAINLNSSK